MAKKSEARLESVGWLFWAIVFAVCLGPAVYVAFVGTRDDVMLLIPIGIGSLLAALVAGITAWAVNSVLQYRVRRQRLAERKKKKRKK
ncbi:MAG: hypothetical protein GY851_18260 [bacterium]|nr:hypothetical protein [bacterium]